MASQEDKALDPHPQYAYSTDCTHFGSLEKNALHENLVSGTVLKSQLTQNFLTNGYTIQKLRKGKPCYWKPRNAMNRLYRAVLEFSPGCNETVD